MVSQIKLFIYPSVPAFFSTSSTHSQHRHQRPQATSNLYQQTMSSLYWVYCSLRMQLAVALFAIESQFFHRIILPFKQTHSNIELSGHSIQSHHYIRPPYDSRTTRQMSQYLLPFSGRVISVSGRQLGKTVILPCKGSRIEGSNDKSSVLEVDESGEYCNLIIDESRPQIEVVSTYATSPRDDNSDQLHRLLSRYVLLPYLLSSCALSYLFNQKLLEKAWCYYQVKPSVTTTSPCFFFALKSLPLGFSIFPFLYPRCRATQSSTTPPSFLV